MCSYGDGATHQCALVKRFGNAPILLFHEADAINGLVEYFG